MKRPLRRWLTLWLLPPMMTLNCLTACSTPSGPCSTLPLIEYDQAFRVRLNQETLLAGPTTRRFVREAVALRDAVRACK